MPMFVRSLDFLLGYDAERMPVEDGMLEREFRLIFNCMYLQLLFNEHDEGFVRTLELGQGRLGASLVSLLFEATKMCADNDKIPIKKVILLLLRVLQCLLDVPDRVLHPVAGSEPDDTLISQTPMQRPRLREFQAFTVLHLHERNVRQKYSSCQVPAAVEEGLQIIRSYKDEFITSYSFHPSEIMFMQSTAFLRDACARYEELQRQGKTAPERPASSPAPPLPHVNVQDEHLNSSDPKSVAGTLGSLGKVAGDGGGGGGGSGSTADDESESASTASSVSSCSRRGGWQGGAGASSDGSDAESCASSNVSDTTVIGTGPTGPMGPCPSAHEAPGDRGTAGADPPSFVGSGGVSSGAGGSGGGAGNNHTPTAVFQRLYLSIFPRLTETIVLLLRLLLTSCSNVDNYPGVIDMARERHATGIADDVGCDRALLAHCEMVMPTEAVEAQRHRKIMAAAVSGVILVLLKQARRSVAEQFSSLAQLITDSNGALVVLKFLNQDLSSPGPTTSVESRADAPPVLLCLWGPRAPPGAWLASWPACVTFRLVQILHLLCKDSPERVRKYLIHRIENQEVQSLVLKLLKKQVRYLPRKWKQANMKAISAIYSLVPMSPLEDWLLNEPLGEPSTEGPSQADIRTSNVVYNAALLQHLSTGPGGQRLAHVWGSNACAPGTSNADAQAATGTGGGGGSPGGRPPAGGGTADVDGAGGLASEGWEGSTAAAFSRGAGDAALGMGVDASRGTASGRVNISELVVVRGGSRDDSSVALLDALYEEVGNEAQSYGRLFPEYQPVLGL
eukprot:NODE_585_length_2907_cov_2.471942.p1 GENE.NODE_585_length_2907_cov_2.471942~~NODE_585_length_2907_cov_2.471942.p1  ORF type:complete len:890 (-),score=260.41 NODE_585_length_2907_cov_2.471942:237-2606(-)